MLFSTRIILLPIFYFTAAFSEVTQKKDVVDWSITDYVKNLPKQEICDYVADETLLAKAGELSKHIDTAKTIYLDWD